jgi:phosphoglycolate phosphatase-like HAD superfamily hydrolase
LVEAEAGAQDQVNALVDQGSDASDKQDGTTKSQVQTQDDAAAAEVDNGAKARSQRTVRTGRVIAIDLDDAFLAASAEDVESAQVVPGVINALKALHEMGHPVHLISRRSSDDLGKVAQWLSQLGLSIGIKEDDVVAAVWLVDGQAAFEEKGKNQSGMLAGGRKLMVS